MCSFSRGSRILGRQVSNQGLSLSQENIKAVIDWPLPKTTREVEQFLGLVNYHRLFLKDLAKIAVPLYNITGKNKFKWEEEQEMAFANIKTLITTAPLLSFTVRTDHHSLLWLLNFKEPQGQLAR